MDDRTQQILKIIQSHVKIKNYLTVLCYFLIVSGLLFYIFYAFSKANNNIKFVTEYKDNAKEFSTQKTMTNPHIKFEYSNNQIYDIKAEKAFHESEKEVLLYNVSADGEIGKITSGQLKINQEGDHLIFTENPVLILNSKYTENE